MSSTATILILPGLYNSGAGHWQTIWEQTLPNAVRVEQQSWDTPDRGAWVAALDAAIGAAEGPVVLAAHSLGCALTAWWCATGSVAALGAKVRGALLAAPPDVERPDFPAFVTGFAPMPRRPLLFKSIVAASSDDPWCAQTKARAWASDWGSSFYDIGARGHVNADSGLGDWEQGRIWLRELGA